MDKKNKYCGTLLGLALGDALGAPFEFMSKEMVKQHVDKHGMQMRQFIRGVEEFPSGFYTDDTAQMICLSESILEKEFDVDHQRSKYMMWLEQGYASATGKAYGIGQQTLRSLISEQIWNTDHHIEDAGGNGSLMRSAPIALAYSGDHEKIRRHSIEASYVTHPNKIAAECCAILNHTISLVLSGITKQDLMQKLPALVNKDRVEVKLMLEQLYNLKEQDLQVSGYSLDTLRIAFWSFLNSNNYTDSIKMAINFGGDTDTFAAVTGSLSGAYYGASEIPSEWVSSLMRSDYIIEIANKLYTHRYGISQGV